LKHCANFKQEKSDLEHLATKSSGCDATINILFTPNIIVNWPVKVSNIAGVQRKKFTENCHSRTEGLGSPSRTVVFHASAKSTLQCANNFQGRHEATCLVIDTKP
jgi:hypothetical protein